MAKAYFITFHTYGTWLHGSEKGSVDMQHNQYGSPVLLPHAERRAFELGEMTDDPFVLSDEARLVAEKTIREVCDHRHWSLLEVHARTTHVHLIVRADVTPEKVMSDTKALCSRRLAEAGLVLRGRKIWSRHGSTRYLWDDVGLTEAIDYVRNFQGRRIDETEPRA